MRRFFLSSFTPSTCPATLFTFQRAFNVYGSSVIQPSIPSSVALGSLELFERVVPDNKRLYFLYDLMNHSNWVDWWLQTEYGSQRKIKWDSKHGRAKIWKEFEQVAHSVHGTAKVMCKNCSAILEHPHATRKESNGSRKDERHGKTTMIRHVNTSTCQRAAIARRQKMD